MSLKQIYSSSTPLRKYPDHKSLLDTECLFGEYLRPVTIENDWIFCHTKIDNYKGWVHSSSLGNRRKVTHRVIVTRTHIYSLPNEKSNIIHYLPMGSRVWVTNMNEKWAKIFSPHSFDFEGYIPQNDILDLKLKVKDWVSSAEQLIGTPYKWGGRDSLGIDCSSLIQIALDTVNIKIPRDTSKQVRFNNIVNIEFQNIDRGSIVYWSGHVGVMINKSSILHANAYHMKTVVEPLVDVIARAKDQNTDIIKIINFI